LGSFGDGYSTKRRSKLFVEAKDGLFAVCAGNLEAAGEFLPKVIENGKLREFTELLPFSMTFGRNSPAASKFPAHTANKPSFASTNNLERRLVE